MSDLPEREPPPDHGEPGNTGTRDPSAFCSCGFPRAELDVCPFCGKEKNPAPPSKEDE